MSEIVKQDLAAKKEAEALMFSNPFPDQRLTQREGTIEWGVRTAFLVAELAGEVFCEGCKRVGEAFRSENSKE